MRKKLTQQFDLSIGAPDYSKISLSQPHKMTILELEMANLSNGTYWTVELRFLVMLKLINTNTVMSH
jgi:hypothetical protein